MQTWTPWGHHTWNYFATQLFSITDDHSLMEFLPQVFVLWFVDIVTYVAFRNPWISLSHNSSNQLGHHFVRLMWVSALDWLNLRFSRRFNWNDLLRGSVGERFRFIDRGCALIPKERGGGLFFLERKIMNIFKLWDNNFSWLNEEWWNLFLV